jgi:hypothetical protein
MAFRRLTPARGNPVELSTEQASVLACVQAGLGEADTCESTGLDASRVAAVVQHLQALHVLERLDGEPSSGPQESSSGIDGDELPLGIEPWSGDAMPEGIASSHDELRVSDFDQNPGAHSSSSPAPPSSLPPGFSSLPPGLSSLPPGSHSSLPPRRSHPPAVDEVNYRRVYETRFRSLEVGERADAAPHVHGSELFALALDPAPEVIAALLDNAHFGLDHARVVALHHKSPAGLEILARRAQLLRDAHVQRRLLQNLQTPENVLDRVLRLKRLLDIYRLSLDRDLPERNRSRVRSRLRPRFSTAEPEERASLIIKTEGRCLLGLSGCTFDGRTAQLLCQQAFLSTLFIQNLARFPATPAVVIIKLLRSPAVQRQPQLRNLLLRHPNAPSDGKR